MEFEKQFKIILVIFGIIMFIQLLNSSIVQVKQKQQSHSQQSQPQQIETYESFESENIEPKKKIKIIKIKYLNKEEGGRFFNNLDYLTGMNSLNIKLRNNQNSNKSNCINKYVDSLLDFTPQDKKKLESLLITILNKDVIHKNKNIIKNFIRMMITKIYFSKSNNWLESGMPHTHKNVVFLPIRFFDSRISDESKEATLIHEIFHIYQRIILKIDVNKFNRFYKHLNFKKVNYIHNFNEIYNRNRHNPDGLDLQWVWSETKTNNNYWIGAVFNYDTSKTIMDVSYLAYPLTKMEGNNYNYEEFQSPIPLSSFKQFHKFFGISNNHYHPNEITAQYMENIYMGDKLTNLGYVKFKNKIESFLKMN